MCLRHIEWNANLLLALELFVICVQRWMSFERASFKRKIYKWYVCVRVCLLLLHVFKMFSFSKLFILFFVFNLASINMKCSAHRRNEKKDKIETKYKKKKSRRISEIDDFTILTNIQTDEKYSRKNQKENETIERDYWNEFKKQKLELAKYTRVEKSIVKIAAVPFEMHCIHIKWIKYIYCQVYSHTNHIPSMCI